MSAPNSRPQLTERTSTLRMSARRSLARRGWAHQNVDGERPLLDAQVIVADEFR